MKEVYTGSSEGFKRLVNGYLDYGKAVIQGRAFQDLRDGLKPVQRRIIYSAHKSKNYGTAVKCVNIVSDALKMHPHGDGAVYNAFTLMTEQNGSWNMPVFTGFGSFGHVYSSGPPAAMRYPKAMLNELAKDYFIDQEVMEMVQSEEDPDMMEPEVLNCIYPSVLVNGMDGVAVSVGSKILSFNAADVIDLTCKYLREGSLSISDIIYPDFPTGGVLVKKDSELAKIMKTGVGKLKVRAKVNIIGKEIHVEEAPVGKTFQSIVKAVKNADIKGISSAADMTDKNNNGLAVITCKSKSVVEDVLLELYRRNILQNVFASRMTMTMGKQLLMIGVHEVIEKWSEWRLSVVDKKYRMALEGLAEEMSQLGYFLRLISDSNNRDKYIDLMIHSSSAKRDCSDFLSELFSDIPESVCNWIYERQASAFNNGGRYKNRYDELVRLEKHYKAILSDLSSYVIAELENFKRKYRSMMDRKTEITNYDYKFTRAKYSDEEVLDMSPCTFTLYRNGFIKKEHGAVRTGNDILASFEAPASGVLVGFDSFGRVVRLRGNEIPFTGYGEDGVYAPKLLDAAWEETYRLMFLCPLDGRKYMLVYRDGYVGYFDTSEWIGKKVVRFIDRGVDVAVGDKLLKIYPEDKIPECLIMAGLSEGKIRLGIINVPTISERRRQSRAKVLPGVDIDAPFICGTSIMETIQYIGDYNSFVGKYKFTKPDTFLKGKEFLVAGEYAL